MEKHVWIEVVSCHCVLNQFDLQAYLADIFEILASYIKYLGKEVGAWPAFITAKWEHLHIFRPFTLLRLLHCLKHWKYYSK